MQAQAGHSGLAAAGLAPQCCLLQALHRAGQQPAGLSSFLSSTQSCPWHGYPSIKGQHGGAGLLAHSRALNRCRTRGHGLIS